MMRITFAALAAATALGSAAAFAANPQHDSWVEPQTGGGAAIVGKFERAPEANANATAVDTPMSSDTPAKPSTTPTLAPRTALAAPPAAVDPSQTSVPSVEPSPTKPASAKPPPTRDPEPPATVAPPPTKNAAPAADQAPKANLSR